MYWYTEHRTSCYTVQPVTLYNLLHCTTCYTVQTVTLNNSVTGLALSSDKGMSALPVAEQQSYKADLETVSKNRDAWVERVNSARLTRV